MSTPVLIKTINDAVVHQPLRDILKAMLNRNLNNKNVGSVTASDTGLRISTAGDFTINGVVYTKAASSAVFALTSLPAVAANKKIIYLCTLNASGVGTVTAGDAIAEASSPVRPDPPSGGCPVAEMEINTKATFTPATTTFSQVVSDGGSVTIRQLDTAVKQS